MANKRMFSKQITESDAFLDMPVSSQLLYFHLNMGADDDGFVANPKRIIRMVGSAEDDLKVLLSKRFLLAFESGVVVIKHWLLHNAVRKDMYKETQYIEEKKGLKIKENGVYTEIRNESVTNPVHRLDKIRLDKVRLGKVSIESVALSAPLTLTKNLLQEVREITSEFISNGADAELCKRESNKFYSYWTEPNKSKTKLRWQLEKTWDTKRRLYTWFSRVKEFSNDKSNSLKITKI